MDDQKSKIENPEIDLLELVRQLWAKKGFIVKITAIAMVVGLVVAFSIPREYTTTVKMAPENAKTSITGNISDLATMAGLNIGMPDEDGINQTLYPDIVQSTPFIAELLGLQVNAKGSDADISLYYYLDKKTKSPWWGYVLAVPSKILNLIHYGNDKKSEERINPYNLTFKQEEVFLALKERVNVSIDKKTGIIMAGVTLQDPVLAAIVADSLVLKLERFVIDYRTNKAKQDLDFALKIFTDSKQKYYDAQKSYAGYVDRNKNIVLESVLIEQERLRNEQALAYNVYSGLAQQVEKAKMKVQEQTPTITVIEPARVPARKSNTSKLTIMILFGVAGCLIGAVRVFYTKRDKILTSK